MIEQYCADHPILENAIVDGTFERKILSEANMACHKGYNAVIAGESLKMICTGATAESGVWKANGFCESMLICNALAIIILTIQIVCYVRSNSKFFLDKILCTRFPMTLMQRNYLGN